MRLVLFDMDGTLVDSAEAILGAHREAFASLGLPSPKRESLLSLVGLSLRPTFERLVGVDGPVDELARLYREAFRARVSAPGYREMLFDGVDGLLRDLASHPDLRLGLVTGKSRRGVERILEGHAWGDLFETIQTADDAPSKPHPAMAQQAMNEVGATPAQTVVVGDTTFDIIMARNAGCRAFGVGWGHHAAAALIEAGADCVAPNVSTLATALGLP